MQCSATIKQIILDISAQYYYYYNPYWHWYYLAYKIPGGVKTSRPNKLILVSFLSSEDITTHETKTCDILNSKVWKIDSSTVLGHQIL